MIVKRKKRNCQIGYFVVPADHREKFKESEKKDEYLELAKKLKRLWNMKVTVIPIIVDVLQRIITEPEELGSERTRGIHPKTTALFRWASILKKCLVHLRWLNVS